MVHTSIGAACLNSMQLGYQMPPSDMTQPGLGTSGGVPHLAFKQRLRASRRKALLLPSVAVTLRQWRRAARVTRGLEPLPSSSSLAPGLLHSLLKQALCRCLRPSHCCCRAGHP